MESEYLDMSEEDIDNLLLGIDINDIDEYTSNLCIACKSEQVIGDDMQGYSVCMNCGVINETLLNKNPIFTKESEIMEN